MNIPLGLRVLVASGATLMVAASGFAVTAATSGTTVAAAPAPLAAAPAASSADDLLRPDEVSRSATRTALTARSASLAARERAIASRDKAIKAEAARKVAARKAAEKAFLDRWGFAPGTTDPREMARQMMATKYGWGAEQFRCYDNIIMRESRWITTADNPTSSAYGIPQALPGRKMASAGADWRTNPATQIRWGLGYVKDRFGSPCQAWSFKRAHGWY